MNRPLARSSHGVVAGASGCARQAQNSSSAKGGK